MSLIECRECGKEVSDSAKSCPSCGISRPGQSPESRDRSVWFLVPIIGIILGIVYLSNRPAKYPIYWSGEEEVVYAACQEATLEHLNAPSTAIFSDPLDESTSIVVVTGATTTTARYSVEAENALGGRVTNGFWCSAVKDAGGDWQVEWVRRSTP